DFDSQQIKEESEPIQIDLDLNQIEEELMPIQADLVAPTRRNLGTKKISKPGRKPGVKHNRQEQQSLITAQIKNSARITSRKGKERVTDNTPVVRSFGEHASVSTNISLNGNVGSSSHASRAPIMPMKTLAETIFKFYRSLKPPSPGLTREQMLRLGTYIFDELLSREF
ncbi:1606_t:CDS:1, partial [Dentiscutata heterogama]